VQLLERGRSEDRQRLPELEAVLALDLPL